MGDELVLFWNDRRKIRLPGYRKFVVIVPGKREFASVRRAVVFRGYEDVIFHLWLLEHNNVFARHALAVHLLVSGDGREDDVRAVTMLQGIAFTENGCSIVWHTLGLCHRHGIVVSRNEQEAQRFFRKGDSLGCLFSRSQLSRSG